MYHLLSASKRFPVDTFHFHGSYGKFGRLVMLYVSNECKLVLSLLCPKLQRMRGVGWICRSWIRRNITIRPQSHSLPLVGKNLRLDLLSAMLGLHGMHRLINVAQRGLLEIIMVYLCSTVEELFLVCSLHSKRICSIMWSLEALRDLHTTKVTLEVSSAEAWKAFISPERFPNVSYVLSRLCRIANDFEHFQLLLSPRGINSAALSTGPA